ncbi:MAG: hypothetical protein FIB08_03970 [Candidatus Methanoperedens sp.]|nr:hypothetical protein [Candidatus Methanoperedens sp.]
MRTIIPVHSIARCECAGVSPPGDSLICGRVASQRQGLISSMSPDLRTAVMDKAPCLRARSSPIGGC